MICQSKHILRLCRGQSPVDRLALHHARATRRSTDYPSGKDHLPAPCNRSASRIFYLPLGLDRASPPARLCHLCTFPHVQCARQRFRAFPRHAMPLSVFQLPAPCDDVRCPNRDARAGETGASAQSTWSATSAEYAAVMHRLRNANRRHRQ